MAVAVILFLLISLACVVVGAIHWFFHRLDKDQVNLADFVQKIPLPPRRSTVDVMANPRPLPGTLRIGIHPAEDLDGQWIADVQPVDIITQGRDMVHAIEAAAEAVQMCWEDDQANGLNFWDRGRVRGRAGDRPRKRESET
jgi:hypothetical protein